MTQRTDPADASPERPALAITEREPDPENPWSDDMLDRRAIGERLTNIVRAQEAPFPAGGRSTTTAMIFAALTPPGGSRERR